jgi:peptidoglycan hydrolase-like protein with peptidoglycan-binding domain
MISIASCESGFRQFEGNGSPLYGGTDNEMIGVFQLDEPIHYSTALALGFDITTLAGNMGYARYLYGEDGTDPWISSFPCWGAATSGGAAGVATTTATSTAASTIPALTLNLSLGEIDPQVMVLQQLLNQAGFTLATSGPGSPGNETTKFGALTYAALRKFQCAQGIACSGDEATTGYGLLNAPTRAALLALTSPAAAGSAAPGSAANSSTIVVASATSSTPAPSATSTAASVNELAEVASLQSRIAALVTIVSQLEAEIAAHTGH